MADEKVMDRVHMSEVLASLKAEPMSNVSFQCPLSTIEQLRELAAASRISLSVLLRATVIAMLEEIGVERIPYEPRSANAGMRRSADPDMQEQAALGRPNVD